MTDETNHPAHNEPQMGLTRRELSSRLLIAAGMAASAGLLMSVRSVSAQPPRLVPKRDRTPSNQPNPNNPSATPAEPKSFLDDLIKIGRTHDWDQKISIHLDSYQDPMVYAQQPGVRLPSTPQTNPTEFKVVPFKFATAAVLFPAIKSTASSKLTSEVTATLRFDGRVMDTTATFIDDLPCGARYGRWDMKDLEGRTVDLDVDIPATTWETIFNEALAAKVIWPASGTWPRIAQSTFGPQMGIDVASPLLQESLTKWCSGKPPKSIPPVQLAKFLAAKVLEAIQPDGDGLVSSKTGLLQGFNLKGAELTLKEGRGSEHDIASVLCALYRNAGLPARLVIGYDVSESKGEHLGLKRKKGGDLRSWVEFCVVDETVTMSTGGPKEVWVPVDVARQRKFSSKAPPLERPWKFFGSNDELVDVVPIAFHFHPPLAGVVAHGSPCFWGWMTTPEMQNAEQMVRFTTITQSKTAPPSGPGGYK